MEVYYTLLGDLKQPKYSLKNEGVSLFLFLLLKYNGTICNFSHNAVFKSQKMYRKWQKYMVDFLCLVSG